MKKNALIKNHKAIIYFLSIIFSIFIISCYPNTHLLSPPDTKSEPFYSKADFLENFNFGILIRKDPIYIYRSGMLGKKGLRVLKIELEKRKLPFPKTIIYLNRWGYGEPWTGSPALKEYLLQDKYGYQFYHAYHYKYRTYLDGENPYKPSQDIDKAWFLGDVKNIFGLIKDNRMDGGMDAYIRILKLTLKRENQPVLFHCYGGKHRAGMVAMGIRYLQGGIWVSGRKRILRISGKEIPLNPAQYEYYLHNKDEIRIENLRFIEELFESNLEFTLELLHTFKKTEGSDLDF